MTRETKIGLLVGLAFIIVIGILLSDHLSNTNEPPTAALAQAGDTVRQGVGLPANPQQPAITVVPPVLITPAQPVPTHAELNRPAPGIVREPQIPQLQQPPQIDPQLHQLAQQIGEELIPANQRPTEQQQPQQTGVIPLIDPTPPAVATREYKVLEGDSLSKIAAKFYGSATKANIQALVAANPSLKGDPNRVIVGRTYVIPAMNGTAALVAPPPTPAPQARAIRETGHEYWYTVKASDNLWKIAAEQLGNGNAWTAIKELNKDVLKGNDTVRTNMRLRLPARPLASAQ